MQEFWSKVDIKSKDVCWNWKAGRSNDYGSFRLDNKTMHASRASWIITNGSILDNKLVLHKCDNKLCCNPDHLYLGTQSDNMRDKVERNPGNSGAGYHHAKLCGEEIRLIRKTYKENKGKILQSALAKLFGVSPATISKVTSLPTYLSKEGFYI